MSEEKCCSKCDHLQPLTEFYFNNNGKRGAECRACYKARKKREKAASPEKAKAKIKRAAEAGKEYRAKWRREERAKLKRLGIVKKPSKDYHAIYKSDPTYRLRRTLRSRLKNALKRESKLGSAVKDLGCDIVFFKEYIEALWWPGMSWSNYGEWHLDHIIGLANFDLSVEGQLKIACHFSNYQPLWATDNLSKKATVPDWAYVENGRVCIKIDKGVVK